MNSNNLDELNSTQEQIPSWQLPYMNGATEAELDTIPRSFTASDTSRSEIEYPQPLQIEPNNPYEPLPMMSDEAGDGGVVFPLFDFFIQRSNTHDTDADSLITLTDELEETQDLDPSEPDNSSRVDWKDDDETICGDPGDSMYILNDSQTNEIVYMTY